MNNPLSAARVAQKIFQHFDDAYRLATNKKLPDSFDAMVVDENIAEITNALNTHIATQNVSIVELEAECARLREALEYIAVDDCTETKNCFEEEEEQRSLPKDDYFGSFTSSDFCNPCFAKYTIKKNAKCDTINPSPVREILRIVCADDAFSFHDPDEGYHGPNMARWHFRKVAELKKAVDAIKAKPVKDN